MSASIGDNKRRIVPRWRDSRVIDASSEPVHGEVHRNIFSDADVLSERIRDWRTHKGVFFATDLVGAAIAYGKWDAAKDAAQYLLSRQKAVPAPALRLARIVLGKEKFEAPIEDVQDALPQLDQSRRAIRELRRSLLRDPRNVLHRVDMARHYAALGLKERAQEEMKLSLSLVPEHRFVLRAASRLFVHVGEKDLALDILRRVDRTKTDPWLMSAEIAASSVAGRSAKFAKQGRILLESKRVSPKHVSELASALGTIEFEAGNTKLCKKLVRQSLVMPTDNSVAQAEWIFEHLGEQGAVSTHLTTPRSYEARALETSASSKWEESIAHTTLWMADEPFSSRPATFGSFVAAVGLEDFAKSERFVRFGLGANPNDVYLRSNLVFALINQNRLEEAKKELGMLARESHSGDARVSWLANDGLLKFRQGHVPEGRAQYEKAIAYAGSIKDRYLSLAAMAFWAQEEAAVRSDIAASLFELLDKAPKGLLDPAYVRVIQNAKKLFEDRSVIARLKNAVRIVTQKK